MKKIWILFTLLISTSLYAASNTDQARIAAVLFPEINNQSQQDFITMVDSYIDQAQKQQTNIILFPELLTLNLLDGSDNPTPTQLHSLVQFTNKFIEHLKSKAVATGMIIIGGTTLTEKNNLFYNTAIVALPSGEIKTVNKTLLTPWELSNHITGVGKTEPLSFQTPWGTAVVLICYETESAEIVSKISKLHPNLVFIPSSTSGLAGLNRVQVATKYIAIGQFAYALLTGVETNLSTDKVLDNDVGQSLFATPMQSGYPLESKLGQFNQPDLLIVDADIAKLKQDKLSPKTTFAARDYVLQH